MPRNSCVWPKRISLCLALTMPAVADAQQVYKWKDAAGTMHYSEQPPADAASVIRLSMQEPRATPEQALAEASQALADGQESLDHANRKQRQRMCSTARSNLQLLDSGALVVGSGNIGSATKLSGEQREAARAEAKEHIGKYCND
jgi:hypothetical protein